MENTMNREIKFRAWDIMNKKLYFLENLDCIYDLNNSNNINLIFGKEIIKQDEGIGDFKIMQYLGLKDKNGVGIYEGDIVNAKTRPNINNEIYECIKGEVVIGKYFTRFGIFSSLFFMGGEIEVVGNIYENPELLGEKDE